MIRNQVRRNIWSNISQEGKYALDAKILLLLCIDFFKGFDSKIFPSRKKADYSARSKVNLRRKTLILWAGKFIKMLKLHEISIETVVERDKKL